MENGYLTSKGIKKACVEEAIEKLFELQNHALGYAHREGVAEGGHFYAIQDARLV